MNKELFDRHYKDITPMTLEEAQKKYEDLLVADIDFVTKCSGVIAKICEQHGSINIDRNIELNLGLVERVEFREGVIVVFESGSITDFFGLTYYDAWTLFKYITTPLE